MRKLLVLFLILGMVLTGCGSENNPPQEPSIEVNESQPENKVENPSESKSENKDKVSVVKPFSDLRGGIDNKGGIVTLREGEYVPGDIYTYTFNERTIFEGNEAIQKEIMENGKNPGLGIRDLHKQGFTGKGVSVGIIDQNLLLESPEFSDQIAAYYEFRDEYDLSISSMHGTAVISILAGKTTGVAPEATVYYAAATAVTLNSAYCADGLNWMVDMNETLPDSEKIRVVSVSGAPSGKDSPFEKNLELWDEAVERAQAAGILVMDCRLDPKTGFIEHGFYDPNDPDNIQLVRNGFAMSNFTYPTGSRYISVPCDFRTTVEQYRSGDYFYRYGGSGGLSWGIPYAAGVLALGWQVNPALTADEIKALLFESAYLNEYNELIIYPAAFIEAVQETLCN